MMDKEKLDKRQNPEGDKASASDNGIGRTELVESPAGESLSASNDSSGSAVSETEVLAGEASQTATGEAVELSLEQRLEQAEKKAQEYLDLAQRARAELINFRRRVQQEQEAFRKLAIESFILDLVPFIQSLDGAIANYAHLNDNENPLVDGLRKLASQFFGILRNYGVELFGEKDDDFEPTIHEPLKSSEAEGVVKDKVGEVYQRGIKLAGRIIKPALVSVLVPPKVAQSANDNETPEGEDTAQIEGGGN